MRLGQWELANIRLHQTPPRCLPTLVNQPLAGSWLRPDQLQREPQDQKSCPPLRAGALFLTILYLGQCDVLGICVARQPHRSEIDCL